MRAQHRIPITPCVCSYHHLDLTLKTEHAVGIRYACKVINGLKHATRKFWSPPMLNLNVQVRAPRLDAGAQDTSLTNSWWLQGHDVQYILKATEYFANTSGQSTTDSVDLYVNLNLYTENCDLSVRLLVLPPHVTLTYFKTMWCPEFAYAEKLNLTLGEYPNLRSPWLGTEDWRSFSSSFRLSFSRIH